MPTFWTVFLLHQRLLFLTTLDLFSLTGVNNKDRSGKTPLHTAILSKQFKVVDMLLQYGADVTVTDDAGDTPLHTAIYVGSERLVTVSISAIVVTSHFSFFCSTNASVCLFSHLVSHVSLMCCFKRHSSVKRVRTLTLWVAAHVHPCI